MATITPGTGGTFKQTTAEGIAIESLCYLQLQESNTSKNSSGRDAIQVRFDTDTNEFLGSYSLPVNLELNSDGSLKLVATTYLTGVTFASGSSGTFKSALLEPYCLEVLMYLQNLERISAKNPQNRNYISGNFNSDTGLYSGAFNLPVVLSLDASGKAVFTAQEYLLT